MYHGLNLFIQELFYVDHVNLASKNTRFDINYKNVYILYVNAPDQLHVASGLTMPFVPMAAKVGPSLRTKDQIREIVDELDSGRWLIQPELAGERACLAVVDKKVYIQNDAGIWLSRAPHNVRDFLKLPNGTCFDGKIAQNNFYPFECLAVRGRALVFKPVSERETVALQLVKFLGHDWMFDKPYPKFLRSAAKNLPNFQGVTLKDYMSFYALISKQAPPSTAWIKRPW